MHLEKLELLERELGRFADEHERLREENKGLRERLELQTLQIGGLQEELERLRSRKEKMRDCLARIEGVVGKLRDLQLKEAGVED